MTLLITAGQKKGSHLLKPPMDCVRPTSLRAKQALFNILLSQYFKTGLDDIAVLDCFAGSGSLGLEALSRGAKVVSFVEKDPTVFSYLKKNVQKLSYENRSRLYNLSFDKATYKEGPYDLIFCDPPYGKICYNDLMDFLFQDKISSEKTLLVIETQNKQTLFPTKWEVLQERTYGFAKFHFLRKPS